MLRIAAVALLLALGSTGAHAQQRALVVAATTSFQDSGLFDYLHDAFKARTGMTLKLVSRPTAEALGLARTGFVDIVVGNSPAAVDRFMDEGEGARRIKFMFDDFVIVGPAKDSSGLRGSSDAAAALRKIARDRAPFLSRGDSSGTHSLEQILWEAAGVNPKARSGNWYRESGLGMAPTINLAARLDAYILTDRATWLASAESNRQILVEGDPRLFNQYELIVVNAQKHRDLDSEGAAKFADWIASDDGQAAIAAFRIDGRQVFFPNAKGQN